MVMYKVNKEVKMLEYLKSLSAKEINKLYKVYKDKIYNDKDDSKDIVIKTGIMYYFREYINNLGDKKYQELKKIMNAVEIKDINEEFYTNNFIFIKDDEIIIPEEIYCTFIFYNKDEDYARKLKTTILFYMEANGVLKLNKLQELIKSTDLTITKKDLGKYTKELGLKVIGDIVYFNDLAVEFNNKFQLLKRKESLEAGYNIYSLEEIREYQDYMNGKDYLIKIYEDLRYDIPLVEERFSTANTIYNYIKCGYNFSDNINIYLKKNHLKESKYELEEFDELITNIYFDVPLWELNGYYQDKELIEEEKRLARFINAYIKMNGVLEIDRLVDILNGYHNFEVYYDDIPNLLNRLDNVNIANNCIFLNYLSKDDRRILMKEKSKIKKYKLIDNIDDYFVDIVINNEKLNKLIEKYTYNKDIVNKIIKLIEMDNLNEYSLSTIFKVDEIYLEDNKMNRMLKDLNNFKKNYRLWNLNGFTLNEIKTFKIK